MNLRSRSRIIPENSPNLAKPGETNLMVFKFTIDTVLNKYIPPNRLDRLPPQIGRFLGSHQPSPRADYWIWLEILVSSFCGIALLEGLFKSQTVFTSHHVPIILASYGATAILCFNASSAPLSQPRNVLVGHFLSSVVGVCIQKLFGLSETGRNHYWASGALSVAVSSVVMTIFNCVHPPAGASALLPSIDEQTRQMSWWFLPVQLISSVLIICVALIFGNIIRRYPLYWWTPAPLRSHDTAETPSSSSTNDEIEGITYIPDINRFEISEDGILAPTNVELNELEVEWLAILKNKLKKT